MVYNDEREEMEYGNIDLITAESSGYPYTWGNKWRKIRIIKI